MANERPTRANYILLTTCLVVVVVAATLRAPLGNWDLALFGMLLTLAVLGDVTAVQMDHLKISGSFLALVLAMVFLGGTPAAIIGVVSIVAGSLHWRDRFHDLLFNLTTYATFPFIVGVGFQELIATTGVTTADLTFYLLILAVYLAALAINFAMMASDTRYLGLSSLSEEFRIAVIPLLPWLLAAALMAVGVAFIYVQIGLASVALFGIVLITFQYLLGALVMSQQHAEKLEVRTNQLEVRTKELASFQVGLLSALLRTLDLRDQMTARHSAAVARYSRAIAERAGYSARDSDLVHMAALLHDIGKFILPDRILKANVPLTDEDWTLIRNHPQQGARVVRAVEGYGPIADIIVAHHERIDGTGYPRGLAGDEIPALARMISVADTYDVMTARDSYRTPVSPHEAIEELRRVAMSQLDGRFVEVFVELVEGHDADFELEEAADFERELELEARVAETAAISGGKFGVPGIAVG